MRQYSMPTIDSTLSASADDILLGKYENCGPLDNTSTPSILSHTGTATALSSVPAATS